MGEEVLLDVLLLDDREVLLYVCRKIGLILPGGVCHKGNGFVRERAREAVHNGLAPVVSAPCVHV